ncbi:MAG: hypothetical protein M1814_000307 [Vezdaea aestivalis]|nr:MAG: hypothetical protein M1814_000307 [Vezdaea aestivalis]
MLRVNDCLDYLANQESDYLFLPYQGKASNGNPLEAPYFNADGQGNTLRTYPTKIPSSEGSIGKCNGPVIPYHAYWSGPATWRVELFIKSYIHTQNVECSRFWLWVDSETNPNAADEMLKDPAFLRFIPLVKRGDVVVKAWKFPNRLRLFLDRDRVDRGLFFILPDAPQSKGESIVADHVIRTQVGEDWLVFGLATSSVLPTAISDAVRFVVLHQYGGVYLDMDGLLLRDLRPLLLSDQAGFAERWGIHFHPSRYNTQTLALRANSSLSSYLLHGGVRMGMNFHPQAIGQMVWKDGRNAPGDPPDKEGFLMLETALFDPLWGELDGFKEGPCMIPCMRHVQDVFRDEIPDEWISLPETDLRNSSQRVRTLDTFVRGAWNYHIHNQWTTKPEPSSWLAVVCAAHDQFLSGQMSNFHGEMWHGPPIQQYDQFR